MLNNKEHSTIMMDGYKKLPNKKKTTLEQFFEFHLAIAENRGRVNLAKEMNELVKK